MSSGKEIGKSELIHVNKKYSSLTITYDELR